VVSRQRVLVQWVYVHRRRIRCGPWLSQACGFERVGCSIGSARKDDHTSVIKTVRELFGLGAEFTNRDRDAPSLVPALSLAAPNNDAPDQVNTALAKPLPALLSAHAAAAANGMQAGLAAAAALLPSRAPTSEVPIPTRSSLIGSLTPAVATAQASATVRTNQFLGV
jgi:hypothetical protein